MKISPTFSWSILGLLAISYLLFLFLMQPQRISAYHWLTISDLPTTDHQSSSVKPVEKHTEARNGN